MTIYLSQRLRNYDVRMQPSRSSTNSTSHLIHSYSRSIPLIYTGQSANLLLIRHTKARSWKAESRPVPQTTSILTF
uniref:Uncharacterized protein n=1 Tax=Rhizophora mucronata TaxID=61149 RepID=A0A2P2JIV2_RHIMU